MNVDELLGRLDRVSGRGGTWSARCPGHDDRNPSLSIGVGNDGRILLFCHAGCTPDAVTAAIGLQLRDLMPEDARRASVPMVEQTWVVRDAAGRPVAEHHRRDIGNGEKKVWWTREGKLGLDGLKTADLPLYGAERLSSAAGASVVLVEGEKAADALAHRGFLAVGTVTGASGVPATSAVEALRGREVILWPDFDDPGHEHMERISKVLIGVASGVRMLRWGQRDGDDAADFFARGNTSDDLRQMLIALRQTDLDPTDLGNARRFVAQHGHEVRYAHELGDWYAWSRTHWKRGDSSHLERWAKATIDSLHDAARETVDKDRRKELYKLALRSQTKQRIESLLWLARSEEAIAVSSEQLDADDWLLNCLNGTLNLRTGVLLPHQPEDLITRYAPVAFDPDAECRQWDSFLDRIMNGNRPLVRFLQRAVGYALTGSTREQVLFFLYGTGANGKTTFINTIEAMLGTYSTHTPSETLLTRHNTTISNDVARLFGVRFVSAVEAGEGRRLDEAKVKELTGGDTLTARFLYREFFTFRPKAKIFFATNHRPEIRGTDEAIWRRIRLIPFTVTIPAPERDPDLTAKLAEELPGILAWAAAGCLRWQQEGLSAPEEVRSATNSYRTEQDLLGEFLADRCRLEPDGTASSKDIYTAYASWWDDNGHGGKPMTGVALGMRLRERGFEKWKGARGQRMWRGITLAGDQPPWGTS